MIGNILALRVTGPALYAVGAGAILVYLASRGALVQWSGVAAAAGSLAAFALSTLSAVRFKARHTGDPPPERDALTGVPTRALLFARLDAALASARRRRHDVAILYVDFGGMRRVNDAHGHAAGDRVLAEIGARLRSAVRSDETVARVGGDEFVVLLPHVQGYNEPEEAARRIAALFAKPFDVGSSTLEIAASIGIARSPYDGWDRDRLLENADAAMYAGRRSIEVPAPA